jgi:hypothetical protein
MNRWLRPSWTVVMVAITCAWACGTNAAAADPIPTDLARVESAAEAGFDAALTADSTQLAKANATVKRSWAAYRGRALRDRVPADALAAVDAAIAHLDSLVAVHATGPQLARAYDAISAPMGRIYAVYKPPVPATLLDLDQLGRALIVDARVVDMPLAEADLARLAARWASFRARVVAVGDGRAVASMDAALARARAAIEARDATALERAAVAETDVVDVIEKLFADRTRRGAD